MKRVAPTLAFLLGSFALVQTAVAVTAENPYSTIVDRNAFGLNPPPPAVPAVQPEPPVKIDFTGITSFGGQKRAWFIVYSKNPADPKSPPRYVNLPEGQRDDILEVVKISEKEGEVSIRNSGMEQTLSFKNNAPKGATIAPQPGPPGMGGPMPIPHSGPGPAPISSNYAPGQNSNSGVVAQNSGAGLNSGKVAGSGNYGGGSPTAQFGNGPQPVNNSSFSTVALPGAPSTTAVPIRPVRLTPQVPPSATLPAGIKESDIGPVQKIIAEDQIIRASKQGIELPPFPGTPQPTTTKKY